MMPKTSALPISTGPSKANSISSEKGSETSQRGVRRSNKINGTCRTNHSMPVIFDHPSSRPPGSAPSRSNPHHRLADILAVEHADQRRRRAVDALVDRLAILHSPVLQPPLHLGGELVAQVREICRDEPADGDA